MGLGGEVSWLRSFEKKDFLATGENGSRNFLLLEILCAPDARNTAATLQCAHQAKPSHPGSRCGNLTDRELDNITQPALHHPDPDLSDRVNVHPV